MPSIIRLPRPILLWPHENILAPSALPSQIPSTMPSSLLKRVETSHQQLQDSSTRILHQVSLFAAQDLSRISLRQAVLCSYLFLYRVCLTAFSIFEKTMIRYYFVPSRIHLFNTFIDCSHLTPLSGSRTNGPGVYPWLTSPRCTDSTRWQAVDRTFTGCKKLSWRI